MLLEQKRPTIKSLMEKFFALSVVQQQSEAANFISLCDSCFERVENQRNEYHKDLQILTRILLDLAKIFGVVDASDNIKNLDDENMGALVMESIGRIMQKAMSTKMPVIGKRYEQELMNEFAFLQALLTMAGKYKPCTKEELRVIIESANPLIR